MTDILKQRSATQIDVWGRPWYWRAEYGGYTVFCDGATMADYKTEAGAAARIKREVEKPYSEGPNHD